MSRRTFGGIFYLWKHQKKFVNSDLLVKEFAPSYRKFSGQFSKVALYATILTFWRKTSFLKKYFLFPEFSDIERKFSRFVAENTDRKRNFLWFDCVKGSTLNKDGSFKTSIKFAVFFRRRTKTNWLLPEKNSMFFTASCCVSRSSFQRKYNKKLFSLLLFCTWGGNSIDSDKKFLALLSKLHSTCPEVKFWDFFWDKNERFLISCKFLSGKFPEGLFGTAFRDFTGKI